MHVKSHTVLVSSSSGYLLYSRHANVCKCLANVDEQDPSPSLYPLKARHLPFTATKIRQST